MLGAAFDMLFLLVSIIVFVVMVMFAFTIVNRLNAIRDGINKVQEFISGGDDAPKGRKSINALLGGTNNVPVNKPSLPKEVTCPECKSELILSDEECRIGKFTCPKCKSEPQDPDSEED